MRGLNDRLQRKMAMCLDLTYSRAVSTALAIEAKNAGHGKSKGYAGERSTQEPEKRTRLVIRPFNPNCSSPRPPTYPFKQPVFIRPTPAPAPCNTPGSTNNPVCYCTTLPTSIYKISAASPLQDCIKEGATEYKHIS
jgi:hypothetical protein